MESIRNKCVYIHLTESICVCAGRWCKPLINYFHDIFVYCLLFLFGNGSASLNQRRNSLFITNHTSHCFFRGLFHSLWLCEYSVAYCEKLGLCGGGQKRNNPKEICLSQTIFLYFLIETFSTSLHVKYIYSFG